MNMNKHPGYSMRLIGILLLLLGVLAAGCADSSGGGGVDATPDTTAPTVNSTDPADDSTDVAINQGLSATFSEAMDPATISTSTFLLAGPGTTPVAGTVSYDGSTATFMPASDLATSTEFTATITTGATDAAAVANALAGDKVWTFTTGVTPDTTAPTVSSTDPADDATDVAFNRKIAATFSEAMDPATISTSTFLLAGPGTTPVAGTVSYVGSTATFTPASDLATNTEFTATITTGATDLATAANALASDKVWTFTTGTATDTTAPTVTSTIPVDAATDVAINQGLSATFSEEMDPATITPSTFLLTGPGTTPVAGDVTYGAGVAVFSPTSDLAENTQYTATITTDATDLAVAANGLAADYVWTFTTGTLDSAGPVAVDLQSAGNFVTLAKTGVSTTGTTSIVGDIGLSPAAASDITGFGLIADATNVFSTSALVDGQVFAADYAPPTPTNLTTAVLDMQAAYTDAAGRTLPDVTELGAGDISGKTLVPGLYKWGTGVLISSGVELLGGPNDVWIFQIAGTLTVSNGAIVTLSGGALPENVYWQVADQATLGTTSDFKGVVLGQSAIVLQTGAVMNGRTLSQSAVTLDSNAVTEPTP